MIDLMRLILGRKGFEVKGPAGGVEGLRNPPGKARPGAAGLDDAGYGWLGSIPANERLALRRQLARNHLAVLMISQGPPLLLAGDEVLRTQRGNNNAYCQDNEVAWFDWALVARNADFLRFTREPIRLRRRHRSLRRRRFLTGIPGSGTEGLPDIRWHGPDGSAPNWTRPAAHWLAFTLAGREPEEPALHVIFNMGSEAHEAPLPLIDHAVWHRAADTSLPAPADISPPES